MVEYDEDKNTFSLEGQNYISKSPSLSVLELTIYISIIIFLSLFGSLISAISIGYFSNDDLVLELRSTSGTEEEKRCTAKIRPILSNRNWLFATLLVLNYYSIICTIIFLSKITNAKIAVAVSIVLIIAFNEIIPQRICSGPNQLSFAAKTSEFIQALMYITSPITFPLGKILDKVLEEKHRYRLYNSDLKALIELHKINAIKELNEEEAINIEAKESPELYDNQRKSQGVMSYQKLGLNDEEANLMISALEIREKQVFELMIPIDNTFMIDYDEKIDKQKLMHIIDKGYSRIPIYANHNTIDILGLVRIKQLFTLDLSKEKTLREHGMRLKAPLVIHPCQSLIEVLREFRKGKSHMAFITEQVEKLQNKFGLTRNNSVTSNMNKLLSFQKSKEIKILGIVTLEDVIERIFNLEIFDEDDYEKIQLENRNTATSGSKSVLKNKKLHKIEETAKGESIDGYESYKRISDKNALLNHSDSYSEISKPNSNEQILLS